jgi:hypothetical protein
VTASYAGQSGLYRAAYHLERGEFFVAQALARDFARGKEIDELDRLFRTRA